MSCPDCCVNVPNIENPKHYSIEYLKKAAHYFYGIDNLRITGGEPTMHPDFGIIIPMLKEMFGCRLLTLATNGYRVIEHKNVLHHFDDILCTLYPHNIKEVEFLKNNGFIKRNTRADRPAAHIPITRRVSN
jgi:organic radical activating enzyme